MASLRVAWRALVANKLRAALTMLGIVIGVGAVIALMGAGAGASAQIEAQFESLGSNRLVVSSTVMMFRGVASGGTQLTMDDVEALQKLATSVAAVAPVYGVAGQPTVAYGSSNTVASTYGVTPAYATVNNYQVSQGRFITESDLERQDKVVVLGATTASDLFGLGIVSPIGQMVKINRQNYEVIGVLEIKGASAIGNQDEVLLLPLTTAQIRFGGTGTTALSSINLQVVSEDKLDFAEAEVTAIMRASHDLLATQDDDFMVTNQAEIVETVSEAAQVMTVLLSAIAAISLLVGGIGVMNIMMVSVTERTREIGIRKAVGAKRKDIMMQFLVESAMLCLIGGIFGTMLGYVGAGLVSPLLGADHAVVSGSSVALALAVSLGVGMFFGLYPAGRAARLNPIEALRYE